MAGSRRGENEYDKDSVWLFVSPLKYLLSLMLCVEWHMRHVWTGKPIDITHVWTVIISSLIDLGEQSERKRDRRRDLEPRSEDFWDIRC